MANQEDPTLPFPVRFSPDGPEGWMAQPDQPLEHAQLLKGAPFGLDHAYFERPDGRLKTGIWRCTAYSERYDGYPADEFMWHAPIGWSGLIVSASQASGPSGRCFLAQVGGSPMRCAA